MNHEEQLPDFELVDTIGLISNSQSIIKCFEDKIIINANNSLLIYDSRSLELIDKITKSTKNYISEFDGISSEINGGYVLCFDNGTIKIIQDNQIFFQYRAHYKKVNNVLTHENYIISSSYDGNIILYDVFTEDIKLWYKGLSGSVNKIMIHEEQLYVLSTDNCIRIYNLLDQNIKQFCTFENVICDFIILNQSLVLFFADQTSKIYSVETKEYKNFDGFKYFIAAKSKYNQLAVLTKDKLHIYKTNESEVSLQKVSTIQLKQKFIDFDYASENEIALISKNNILKKINIKTNSENTLSQHQNEIFDTILINDYIITCSCERYIIWGFENEVLQKLHNCIFNFHAHCITKFEENVLISSSEKIYGYNFLNNNIIFEFPINNKMIKYNKNRLYVVFEDNLKIFNVSKNDNEVNLSIIHDETFDSHIVYLNVAKNDQYYAVSLLSNYINIHEGSNYDLKLTLYGHSLPVRYFEFSADNKSLLSCGADKVVKLWGVDFGECRKTFIADSKKLSFTTNDSFLCAENGIKYFKKHDLIKNYKVKDIERLFYDGKKLIATSKYGIYYFKIAEYEFIEKEESSELEEELMKETNIINYKHYDRFLEQLNILEDDLNADMAGLFEVIKVIDLAEICKFTHFLNQKQVKIIFKCLQIYFSLFPIVAIRFGKELIKIHSYMCENNKDIFIIYNDIKKQCKLLKDTAGRNVIEFYMLFDNK